MLMERVIGAPLGPVADTGVFGELPTALVNVMLDIVELMPVLIPTELGYDDDAVDPDRLFACPDEASDAVVDAVFLRLTGGGMISEELGEYGLPACRVLPILLLRFELELEEVEAFRPCCMYDKFAAEDDEATVFAPVELMPYTRPMGAALIDEDPAEAEVVRGRPAAE